MFRNGSMAKWFGQISNIGNMSYKKTVTRITIF